MSSECIFCKIANGEIPTQKLYEDEEIIAFEDVSPQAPVHFLIIPKVHIETLDDVDAKHAPLLGKMIVVGTELARKKGISEEGYRHIINCKKSAGQVVYHLHMHIMGGRPMRQMG